jgi:hypothetical protein
MKKAAKRGRERTHHSPLVVKSLNTKLAAQNCYRRSQHSHAPVSLGQHHLPFSIPTKACLQVTTLRGKTNELTREKE